MIWQFHGKIDEVRVLHTGRDANWMAAGYMNQNYPGSGYTVKEEETS
jgi:hypothetical protein